MTMDSYIVVGLVAIGFGVGCGSNQEEPTETSSGDDETTTTGAHPSTTESDHTAATNSRSSDGTAQSSDTRAEADSGTPSQPSSGQSSTNVVTETDSSSDASEPTDTAADSGDEGDASDAVPDDAYVRCSGEELPSLTVEPILLPPKVNNPIYMLNPPGQPNMLYVAERGGTLKRFDMTQDDPVATTLVELSGVATMGEYGFLSFALHPNFDGNTEKRAYLVYTPANSFVIKTYSIDGDTATEGETLFEFGDDNQSNHNGGLALFGPQGYLYVGIGDGGGGNDMHGANGNGQNLNTTYGKILRLDVDDPERAVEGNLTSEAVDGEVVDGRILHYGLRNPWRFSFDRLTDDLYIGDVGQDTREEVDMIPNDQGPTNFGWAAREGFGECPGCNATSVGLSPKDPIFDYENPPGNAESRSVTGGFVYRGSKIPGLYGRYVFADYQTSQFTVLTADGEGGACDVVENPITQNEIREEGVASFAEDVEGELYILSLNDGIFKVVAAP